MTQIIPNKDEQFQEKLFDILRKASINKDWEDPRINMHKIVGDITDLLSSKGYSIFCNNTNE